MASRVFVLLFRVPATWLSVIDNKDLLLALQDRLNTLENVRRAGISVCAGGIIGLGEATMDRVGLLHQVCGELGQAIALLAGTACAQPGLPATLRALCCPAQQLHLNRPAQPTLQLCRPLPCSRSWPRCPPTQSRCPSTRWWLSRARRCRWESLSAFLFVGVGQACVTAPGLQGLRPLLLLFWRLLVGICTVWARCK